MYYFSFDSPIMDNSTYQKESPSIPFTFLVFIQQLLRYSNSVYS